MLKGYDKWDSILMPLHAADPAYLSFERITLPAAVQRGIGVQAMKVFGNAFLLRVLNAEECLRYALSLPIHCAAVGCSTLGQLDDDVRFARQNFKPYTAAELEDLRKRAITAGPGGIQGPALDMRDNCSCVMASGFSTKTGLPQRKRLVFSRILCMGIMARGNDHKSNVGIRNNRRGIRGKACKAEFMSNGFCIGGRCR